MVGVLTRRDTVICAGCGMEAPAWESINCDDGAICFDCYVSRYNVCQHCRSVLPVTALQPSKDGKPVCAACLDYEKGIAE